MGRIAAPLQVQARATGDTRRPATNDAMGVAVVRAVPASFTARLCRGGDPVGRKRIKRRATRVRAVHGLWTQGRNAAASKLGRRACRIRTVPRAMTDDQFKLLIGYLRAILIAVAIIGGLTAFYVFTH